MIKNIFEAIIDILEVFLVVLKNENVDREDAVSCMESIIIGFKDLVEEEENERG